MFSSEMAFSNFPINKNTNHVSKEKKRSSKIDA